MIKIIADPDKYFYTVDKKVLTNLYQLLDYVSYCSDPNYYSHVTSSHNDFANWIEHVLGITELANNLRSTKERSKHVTMIKDVVDKLNSEKTVSVEESKDMPAQESSIKKGTVEASVDQSSKEISNQKISGQDAYGQDASSQKESPSLKTKNVDSSGKFHEFTDEELEKFTKFVAKAESAGEDEKVTFLKYELNELRNAVKELRKSEKDPLIPDLLLRSLDSKIAYYSISKKPEEYDHIVSTFNDIKREIDYCSQEVPYSFADEIIQGLELQKVTMKKK